ncbi:MAG: hypothetical protein WCC00_06470 [Candidatus Aminicenantales bacterium]
MKKTAAFAALMAAGLIGLGTWAAAADKAALAKKQAALTAEYGLAKESKFYFVFDVRGRKVELRVRGMVLETWPIEAMRFWGQPDFSGTVEMVKKTTLKTPERIVIKPGETEAPVVKPAPAPAAKPGAAVASTSADYDLEALELRDMPKRFSLDLDNGLHITVRAKTGSSLGFAARLKEAWRWYVRLPLMNLFGAPKDKRLSELELVIADEKAAQSIYWHLFDGIKGIIL